MIIRYLRFGSTFIGDLKGGFDPITILLDADPDLNLVFEPLGLIELFFLSSSSESIKGSRSGNALISSTSIFSVSLWLVFQNTF
jgi:hypothetical protein